MAKPTNNGCFFRVGFAVGYFPKAVIEISATTCVWTILQMVCIEKAKEVTCLFETQQNVDLLVNITCQNMKSMSPTGKLTSEKSQMSPKI